MQLLHIETIAQPSLYLPAQIENAVRICQALNRGRFVLAEKPLGKKSKS